MIEKTKTKAQAKTPETEVQEAGVKAPDKVAKFVEEMKKQVLK